MKKLFLGFIFCILTISFMASLAYAYPAYVASPREVFDDGAVPQDFRLIESFRKSHLEGYPYPSYRPIGEQFDAFFSPTRWWNYDQYNVVMAGLAYVDGMKSKVRISFYREGSEPVWITYIQVNGETVYVWNENYNKLPGKMFLTRIYGMR